jgi:acyl-CoA synthetase (AMP-forming)/AMP-acid ligase II
MEFTSQLRLIDLLDGHDDAPALMEGTVCVSRGQLRESARRAACRLHRLGLQRGDTLALWLPNGAAWLQLLFACAELGVLVVPISTRYKPAEVRHLLEVSRARLLVVPRRFLDQDYAAQAVELQHSIETLEQHLVIDDPGQVLALPDVTDVAPDLASIASAQSTTGQPDELLCCFSTSGTTGFPKLAAHGHHSIARHAWHVSRAFGIGPGDAMLCALPFYGVFGFMTVLTTLAGGGTCVLQPVFDASQAAQLVTSHRITHAVGSDSMFAPMLDQPGVDWNSLRHIILADFVGLSAAVTERGEALGIACSGTYGSSELYALMSLHDWHAPVTQRALAGGVPLDPDIHIRVVDPEDGHELPDDQAGELQVRGPNMLALYLNNPEATAKAFTVDGWFRTGDLATRQGAGFTYLARMGDSLRLRGYLVNPSEIENELMNHPAVSGAQVVGVKIPSQGDVAVAYVTLQSNDPGEAALQAHCKTRLANYKIPQRVVVVDAFPIVNGPNGGKIQKRVLREWARELLGVSA